MRYLFLYFLTFVIYEINDMCEETVLLSEPASAGSVLSLNQYR